jgi:hypothetical protein
MRSRRSEDLDELKRALAMVEEALRATSPNAPALPLAHRAPRDRH